MSAHESRVNRLTVLIFFILSVCFLFFACPYKLVFKEQIVLFEFTRSFLAELFSKPAAIAELFGTFITQFFIYRWAAVLLTVLCVALIWDGFRRVLNAAGSAHSTISALLPAAAELVLCCRYEYPLSMTIGAAIAVWMALGCIKLKNKTARTAVSALCALVSYPVAGIHCLLFFIALPAGTETKPLRYFGILACAVAYIFASGKLYLVDAAQTFSYPLITGSAIGNVYTLYITEILALCAVAAGKLRWPALVPASIVLILTVAALFLTRDSKSEYDLKISTLAYFGRWDKVQQMGKENPFNSQIGAYYYNVSLAREGKLSDGVMKAYQPLFAGIFLPVETAVGYPKYIASADALLLCGDYSQAQHSILTGMTFTPHCRSSRAARKLAEIAIADGDNDVAVKYLKMLSHTAVHRRWAEEALEMIESGKTYALNHNREMLVRANDFEPALRNIIESGDSHSSTAVEYLICLDLLKKDSDAFISDFRKYYLPNNAGRPLPKLYLEALAMLGFGRESGVPDKTVNECRDFLSGNHNRYKDTYWYYLLYAQPEK